jgi:hypothetical protein
MPLEVHKKVEWISHKAEEAVVVIIRGVESKKVAS